jgi:SagB-type dehydrogenase family enzyme
MTSDPQVLQKLTRGSGAFGLRRKSSLSEIFHENTKLGPLTARAYSAWIASFIRSHSAQRTIDQPYKVYSLMERRELPAVEARGELETTIAARRSLRSFTGEPLGLEELARLLFFTYGRTDRQGRFRAVASGGALYPLELYVVALNVEGLEPGIYHYGVETGALDVVKPGEQREALRLVLGWEGIDIDHASLAIVVTAAFRRTTIKYRDRGYRMILMEAGEVAQNLSLLAAAMNLGACLVGGFVDDRLSDLLDVDGVMEAPLLPVLVGRPAVAAAGSGRAGPAPAASGE